MKINTLEIPEYVVILGDDTFCLSINLIKPYSKTVLNEKIFNYRLCQARRVVENAFGILVLGFRVFWRFRVFSRPIEFKRETTDTVICATFGRDNWLRKTTPGNYLPQHAVNRNDSNTGTITPGL